MGNENIMGALYRMRDEVYSSREENFHWDLGASVELNGRFRAINGAASSDTDEESCDENSEDLSNSMHFSYSEGAMVAARPCDSSAVFWIAQIRQVHKNARGIASRLTVRWFEAYGSNCHLPFKAKYTPSVRTIRNGSKSDTEAWHDTISVSSIFVTFDKLNRNSTIPAFTSKSIRACIEK